VVETCRGGATSVAELMGSSPWMPRVEREYGRGLEGVGGLVSGRFGFGGGVWSGISMVREGEDRKREA
jgi:hypothetical protein